MVGWGGLEGGVLGEHCSFPHLMPFLSCPLLPRNQANLLRGPPPITFPVFLNSLPPVAGCLWELVTDAGARLMGLEPPDGLRSDPGQEEEGRTSRGSSQPKAKSSLAGRNSSLAEAPTTLAGKQDKNVGPGGWATGFGSQRFVFVFVIFCRPKVTLLSTAQHSTTGRCGRQVRLSVTSVLFLLGTPLPHGEISNLLLPGEERLSPSLPGPLPGPAPRSSHTRGTGSRSGCHARSRWDN